jgi:NAD(P)H-nitrite reductase large subunit
MKHVIIGAGPAGVVAAETLREADPSSEVVLVGDEPALPYSRMTLPFFLKGRIDAAGTYLRRGDTHYGDLGIRLLEARAKRVRPRNKRVELENGETLAYDRLLIATGSRPVKPAIEGVDDPRVVPCWTLEHARALIHHAKSRGTAVLMGGGVIGCVLLDALAHLGVELTLVEMEDRILPRMLNRTGAEIVRRWCEGEGVRILTSAPVREVRSSSGDLNVVTEGGTDLEASFVVLSTGVRPCIDFLEGSGIATDHGVLADTHLRTNLPDIFTAGDVAQGPDLCTGSRSVHAVQPTAAEHGRIAGLNMAGADVSYKGSLIMNVLETRGLVSCSFGQWKGVDGGDSCEVVDARRSKYLRLEFAEDRLIGAISVGRVEQIGALRGLILTGVPLGRWKQRLLLDPHRVMEAYVAQTVAVPPASSAPASATR